MSVGDVSQTRSADSPKRRALRLPPWLPRVATALAFALVGLVVMLGVLLTGYQLLYRTRVHRGVSVWNLDLGGMSRAEAQIALIDHFADLLQTPWELQGGEQTWTVTPAALGIRFDAAATSEAIHAVGRSGSFSQRLGEQMRSMAQGVQIAPVLVYDEAATRHYLSGLADEVYRPVRDASLVINGLEIYEISPQVGRKLDIEATLASIRRTVGRLGETEIPLSLIETLPRVVDATIARDRALALTDAPLTLYIEPELFKEVVTGTAGFTSTVPGPWSLSREELAAALVVGEEPVDDAGGVRLSVALDPQTLADYLAPISREVSRTATNARFIFNDDTHKLDVIAPSSDGLALDVEATVERIHQYIAQGEREIPLAFQVVPAEFNEQTTAEELGITELVASSTSYFAGSSQGRMNNVQVAASKFHGIIIKPGETFSFNQWLGEVSEEEGYDESLIIFGNETIPDVGGGVCQVSTTAFRAAFWAGFPITERWAHAYRVGYYEQGGQPVGLDATIYSPHVDLKFVNESPYHLLIETYVNLNTPALVFKFYSTGQGRVIDLEGPLVTDVIEHGEPIYREDPELAPGEIKQIEWATNGLTSVITRTIRSSVTGEVIERKAFKSKFRPWDAVYLVGPGTEVPGHDVIRLDEPQEGQEPEPPPAPAP